MEMSASLVVCIKGTSDKATKERCELQQRATREMVLDLEP